MTTTTETTTNSSDEGKPKRRRNTPEPRARRLSTWRPDPRWAHPVEAALWAYLVALIADIDALGIPPWTLVTLGPVLAWVGSARARRAWPERDYGPDLARQMSVVAVVSSMAAAAWLLHACLTSPFRALGWLALGTGVLGAWYAVLRTSAPRVAQQVAEAREEAVRERANSTWDEILAACGLPLRVVSHKTNRAGYVLGVEPIDPKSPVPFSRLESSLQDITTKAAALLAEQGVTISEGMVRVEPTSAAHVHLIHVLTRQVLRESIPFTPCEDAPVTITDPFDVGLHEDGAPVLMQLGGKSGGQNGKIVGATGSGKSRLVNSIIGRVGECNDVLIGAISTSKLTPLVWRWIAPWVRGECPKPAIDFAAGPDPDECMRMLAAIYQIVDARNRRLSSHDVFRVSPSKPAIVLFIEEAAKLAQHGTIVRLHTGQEVGFSQLMSMIASECRSAHVSIWFVNQSDLFGTLGAWGNEIARNTPFRVCLKTLTPSDGHSTLPALTGKKGADTTKLQHNSMLVQPSLDQPRVMPAKAYNLGNELIDPVARRNGQWRPELEPEMVELVGDVWTRRWAPDRVPDLVEAARDNGLVWPGTQATETSLDEMDRELWALIEEEQAKTCDTTTTGSGGDTATTATGDSHPEIVTGKTAPNGMPQLPDVDGDLAALDRIMRAPRGEIPEPLASVIRLLQAPDAPTDVVATRDLAILLGRVDRDAGEEEIREAARRLGRELAEIDPEIRSEQRTIDGRRVQCYEVRLLRQVAYRLARGADR